MWLYSHERRLCILVWMKLMDCVTLNLNKCIIFFPTPSDLLFLYLFILFLIYTPKLSEISLHAFELLTLCSNNLYL